MKYEATWESLDSRPVPTWFSDAKFGIFIHWGLYSVPAIAERGSYAEWYGMTLESLRRNHDESNITLAYHNRIYGSNTQYADFVKDFKADLFDAKEWVRLFEAAGARYMNITSKHHDGFCLFKSASAPFWNSVEVGPHRDFLAELRDACEGTNIKFGVYHSLFEWWHPDYLRDPETYAVSHLIPMLKELIETYRPHTLFTDGEWTHPDTIWHSTEFLQWLYNESSVREDIVPNDRWGTGTRGVHGGNFTTEYGEVNFGDGPREAGFSKPFEECRGIGKSFGLNRLENLEDYMTPKELIELLISMVARGGNLLLNVGPAADGTIPVIMQERLLQMGQWLSVNGEAIYASRTYTTPSDHQCYYTVNNGHIYAMTDRFPAVEAIFDSVAYQDGMSVRLLGLDDHIQLTVFNANGKVGVKLPLITPDMLASQWYYTYEICL